MPTYEWRRRRTRHFGEVWVPFAEIDLRRADGRYQPLAIQIDSGAVISLLRRSVAELLGINLEAGAKIDLGSVGGNSVVAFRHEIEARLGDGFDMRVSFAIAEREDVPNLLGRVGFFDNLQIDFDASLQETRISGLWLDEGTRRIWDFLIEADTRIVACWKTNPLPGRADEATLRLFRRSAQLMGAVAALVKMHRAYESPLILRAMFELSVQLEYLLLHSEERAELYLEYEHVSRYRYMSGLLRDFCPGTFAEWLAGSPQRAGGEAAARAQYERVRARFTREGKKAPANNWYMQTFRELCEQVGRLAEYKLWYSRCSGWLHADPFGIRQQRQLADSHALMLAMCYHGRVLAQLADQKKILLTNDQYEFLKRLGQGIY
jgi:hypothetical protein